MVRASVTDSTSSRSGPLFVLTIENGLAKNGVHGRKVMEDRA